MTDTNIDLIRNAYAAFHRRDIDMVLDAFAPDIEWTHPDGMNEWELGGTKRGHAEVRAFMRRVPGVFAAMVPTPREFVESGDRVVVFGTHHMRSHAGAEGTVRFVHSWTLAGGKAIRFEDYFDTVLVARLLGSAR
jgi:uncharacterized protein